MTRTAAAFVGVACLLLPADPPAARAQKAPYDVFPAADPPYYRVRYEASGKPGELPYAVNYTVWVPPGVTALRGVVVHQHGCGEGSGKSGLTGAYDLHWQALAKKHDCVLLSPAYEQPEKAEAQRGSRTRGRAAQTVGPAGRFWRIARHDAPGPTTRGPADATGWPVGSGGSDSPG